MKALEIIEFEEPNLPEKLTNTDLREWASARNHEVISYLTHLSLR